MPKLSIIIPSRDEKFLTPTIDDIFRNARDEQTEVIAVLDSDKWPGDWKEVTNRHPRLHTIHNGSPIGMRGSINKGVASAISRGAKYVAKFDGHCAFSEGFDVVLMADCDDDWIVVPRRGRLDPESWTATDTHKPDIDYHYLSFPDDPNDFGGPGLNGKIWPQRAIERAQYELDEEMSSQGSGWFMHASYFTRLELMDEANYGGFWSEFQELGLKCWLSGGRVMVNKRCKYLHLHKGSKYGRGYKLPESWLQQGATFTKNWIWNEAWNKQTKPFNWLIEHFWPVPTWPENWEELLYATRKPRAVSVVGSAFSDDSGDSISATGQTGLVIHSALYGLGFGNTEDPGIDVTERLRSLVSNNSLDVVVNNSTITPGQNPYRGKKKRLHLVYSIDGTERVERIVEEKDWLIIGPVRQPVEKTVDRIDLMGKESTITVVVDRQPQPSMTAAALNDYLIRKFSIIPQRLRGPMPIEVPQFHRNDLAQLFAELGFKRGAEIGVAEGKYSEVLMKANPECELLLIDPWHSYSDNPQNKSKEKHEYAFNETKRRVEALGGSVGQMIMKLSMDAVRDVEDNSLDFCYIDAHHSYPYVMCDIIEWTKRVRSGGIIALDDIYRLDEARWGAGPMEAIYDYTRAMRINPWWLISAHKSVDAFFVKP